MSKWQIFFFLLSPHPTFKNKLKWENLQKSRIRAKSETANCYIKFYFFSLLFLKFIRGKWFLMLWQAIPLYLVAQSERTGEQQAVYSYTNQGGMAGDHCSGGAMTSWWCFPNVFPDSCLILECSVQCVCRWNPYVKEFRMKEAVKMRTVKHTHTHHK